MGNLTRDPELRRLSNGTAVCDITLAVNRKFMNNGQLQEDVSFIDITLWSKTAEHTAQYMRKGSSLFVEGRLQLDTWQDKTSGKNRNKLKVVGDKVQFLSSSNPQSNEFANNAGNELGNNVNNQFANNANSGFSNSQNDGFTNNSNSGFTNNEFANNKPANNASDIPVNSASNGGFPLENDNPIEDEVPF